MLPPNYKEQPEEDPLITYAKKLYRNRSSDLEEYVRILAKKGYKVYVLERHNYIDLYVINGISLEAEELIVTIRDIASDEVIKDVNLIDLLELE